MRQNTNPANDYINQIRWDGINESDKDAMLDAKNYADEYINMMIESEIIKSEQSLNLKIMAYPDCNQYQRCIIIGSNNGNLVYNVNNRNMSFRNQNVGYYRFLEMMVNELRDERLNIKNVVYDEPFVGFAQIVLE